MLQKPVLSVTTRRECCLHLTCDSAEARRARGSAPRAVCPHRAAPLKTAGALTELGHPGRPAHPRSPDPHFACLGASGGRCFIPHQVPLEAARGQGSWREAAPTRWVWQQLPLMSSNEQVLLTGAPHEEKVVPVFLLLIAFGGGRGHSGQGAPLCPQGRKSEASRLRRRRHCPVFAVTWPSGLRGWRLPRRPC